MITLIEKATSLTKKKAIISIEKAIPMMNY